MVYLVLTPNFPCWVHLNSFLRVTYQTLAPLPDFSSLLQQIMVSQHNGLKVELTALNKISKTPYWRCSITSVKAPCPDVKFSAVNIYCPLFTNIHDHFLFRLLDTSPQILWYLTGWDPGECWMSINMWQ